MKTITHAIKLLFIALAVALSASFAQAADSVIAITNGTIHTVGPQGTLQGGNLIISDGRIVSVGTNVAIPEGARVIDAKGKPVTPGLFDALTSIGLSEVTLSAGIEDDEARTSRLVIAPDASMAFNPENTFIPSTRIEGITRAAITMKVTNDIFAGQGTLVHFGITPDHITRPRAFVFAHLGERGGINAGGTRAAAWVEFNAALREAENLVTQPRNHWQGGKGEPLFSRIDLEALLPAVQGEVPLIIQVNRVPDIRRVLDLKKSRPTMRIVLYQATEAWRVAAEIAAAKVAVLLHPLDNLPADFNRIDATMENAARLQAAGVQIAITSWGPGKDNYDARLLPQQTGIAVANGLPWDEALKAVTLAPAEIYGQSDRVGTLEVGKDADVVVWSGDPFEVMEKATHVFIRGEDVPMISRQSLLRDRYRTLPE